MTMLELRKSQACGPSTEKQFPFILHECITTQTRCTICDKLQHSKADALYGGDPALTSSLIGTIDAHTKLHLSERQYQDHKYAKARNFPGLCKVCFMCIQDLELFTYTRTYGITILPQAEPRTAFDVPYL
ncbi:hypothetical protein Pelo_17096 [Pelomyxa schiedti]|nr:hypothetical protein Pelo_17096 [Pelomyxa schiedti]